MANIKISDLNPAGADLFLDSESYLNDLTEGEMLVLTGGASPISTAFTCNYTCCPKQAIAAAQVNRFVVVELQSICSRLLTVDLSPNKARPQQKLAKITKAHCGGDHH